MPADTPTDKIKLAIFISGRGSNMESLVEACKSADFPASVELVLSNRPDAPGLSFAQNEDIKTATIDHKTFDTREEFEDAILAELGAHKIDLICLAGFMRILTPRFTAPWTGRLINIHPSLLPDYKGLHTHERALADGAAEAGCTVHHVIPEMDSGDIIVQKRVPVHKDDTPDTLAARVLEQEHIAYPEAVKIVAQDLLKKS